MTGSIKDYTPNFNLIIPEFNITGWHDYLEENFRSIDAMFYNLFEINNYKGIWTNNTVYNVDDVLFIGEDTTYSGRLIKVLVEHTTAGDGDFTQFFEENPTYYELFADASTAQIYAQQAKDWAVKMGGPVEAGLYSSKYYADLVNAISTEITSLYQIKDSMVNLDNIKENIVSVDNNKTNINVNANNINSIINTSNNILNINSVANNETNINTIANNLEYIQNTATNINDIITCSDNINAIQDAPQAASVAQTSATNAANSATSAQNASNLAQDWAIKTNGPVSGGEHSAKYWANVAEIIVSNRANTDLSNLSAVGENRFNAKQDTLVSGTNIKTINNNSLLGSGNINVAKISDIGDATITITQGGINKGSFTLNQKTNLTIALDTGGSDVEAFTASEIQTIWDGVS